MSWNQQIGKSYNKQLLLKEIFKKKTVSRNDLLDATGLKKATVSNLVAELIEENLLIEDGKIKSTGGRRSTLLRINEQAGFILAIDIGVNYLRGEIIQMDGKSIFAEETLVHKVDFATYLKTICLLLDQLFTKVPASHFGVVGIGIAVPAMVSQDGLVLHAPNLKWNNIDLAALVKEQYNVPVYIINEANAGAYAEYLLNPSTKNLLYISLGIGIGIGMISNEQLYLGSHGVSGENGHMIIQSIDGRQCSCGRTGCWEAYASEYALANQLKNTPLKTISIDELIDLASKQDETALKLFNELGYFIGIGIVNLMHTIDPSKIVIGNTLSKSGQILLDPILQTIQKVAMPYHFDGCEISFSKYGPRSTVIGAGYVAFTAFIEQIQ